MKHGVFPIMRTPGPLGTVSLVLRWARVLCLHSYHSTGTHPHFHESTGSSRPVLSAKCHIPPCLLVPKTSFSQHTFSQHMKYLRKKNSFYLTLGQSSLSSHLLSLCAGCWVSVLPLSFSGSSLCLTSLSPSFSLSPLPF